MISFEYIILIISGLILISVIISRLSDNLGLPSLLLFLIIGMLAGSEGPGKIHFDNYSQAQKIGITSLVLILFSGGLDTRWNKVRTVMWSAFSLATLGVILTAFIVAAGVYFILKRSFLEGLLIGAVISSTDAAAVFSVLGAKATKLKNNVKSTLELESGSNDPMAIVLTILIIEYMTVPEVDFLHKVFYLFLQFTVGGICGYAGGKIISNVLNRINFPYRSFYLVFVIASAFFIYSLTSLLHGSGVLAIYISAVILGNREFIQKKSLVRFFEGFALLGQIVMFLSMGLLVYPSHLTEVVGAGLVVSGILIFVARPLAVFTSTLLSTLNFREKIFISWVGLKGAVPIILATYALIAGLEIGEYIFNLVFFITITSVLLQGWSVPLVAKLMNLSEKSNLTSNLNIELGYDLDSKNELLDILVTANSPVIGKNLAELNLPPECLITAIYRGSDYIVPSGSSQLQEGDIILIIVNKGNIDAVRRIFHLR